MQIFSKRKRNNGTIFSKRKRNNGIVFSKRKRKERFYLGNYIHDTITKNYENYFNQQLKQHYLYRHQQPPLPLAEVVVWWIVISN